MKLKLAHVKLLRKLRTKGLEALGEGACAFNEWRTNNLPQSIRLDFHQEDFSGRDLSGIDFRGFQLKRSRFRDANLRGAELSGANLNDADLTGADLTDADLRQARLARAVLDYAVISGANLYATIRDEWQIKGVQCDYCWITRERRDSSENPERFTLGEFEIAYGGKRFKVRFPDGFEPIDLLALPFHAQSIAEKFRDHALVFTGLTTVGEPALEFRLPHPDSPDVERQTQEYFNVVGPRNRSATEQFFREIVDVYKDRISDKDREIERLERFATTLLESPRISGGHVYLAPVTKERCNETHAIALGENVHQSFVHLSGFDLGELKGQLKQLTETLKRLAQSDKDKSSAESVQEAERAVEVGDEPSALRHLKSAGMWAFDVATKIGTTVAAKALEKAMGLP